MPKSRLSTAVDTDPLASARALCPGCTDASMIEAALRACAVNLDSLESLSVGRLVERIGTLSAQRMRQLCAALAIAVDC
ncbi:hypothetical protein ISU10_22595 [Nocardioides agariphilus]|jgi:mRNA-degrading endonuclease toxin of MazEF toxin-antitoxin module|uniref:Uncharacterized protein n=1 Tax=Nocardioides agariphilus TaxID=433664 RepID=A0A930VTJ8_9ACTN|nr:hypothetical protein [Nocardioides agariphilus]MBF4770570.1 hypothetical protein [Nocardioides agariphilus]